ncbi:MAG: glycosyltransferase family 4 protein [Gammaproteobacteria bacterium]|nr:glycosyltransferase family 4 protein [Gammaproteobacteria bacterium]
MSREGIVVGIDASRNRSGGAIAHVRGLLFSADPRDFGINRVHLWASPLLAERLDERPWLTAHVPSELRGPLWQQLWWQWSVLPRCIAELGCDVLFSTDAGTACSIGNLVALSQDMLSFEPQEVQRYGLSVARLRLEVLKRVQTRSLRRAKVAVFLSEYARRRICEVIGRRAATAVIPHGVDDSFRSVQQGRRPWPQGEPIRCLYVSNAAPYKHQWHVVEAAGRLQSEGVRLRLLLVGGGQGWAMKRLQAAVQHWDPGHQFVSLMDFVPNSLVPELLADADLFIFASSCENLPVTLLEAMASGIAICSSNRGPMPEVLGPDGCYFDPEQPVSIAQAIRSMVQNTEYRERCSADAMERAAKFRWSECAAATWQTLVTASRGTVG